MGISGNIRFRRQPGGTSLPSEAQSDLLEKYIQLKFIAYLTYVIQWMWHRINSVDAREDLSRQVIMQNKWVESP